MVPESMDRAVSGSESDGEDRCLVRYRNPRESGRGTLPAAWGDANVPLVYVTFGTITARLGQFDGFYHEVLQAPKLPVRVLLTTGRSGGASAADVPPNVHVEEFWPQEEVMPRAAAVVAHGGFGTTIAALAAGVPQVHLPLFTTDQGLNAEAVSALGAGVTLTGGPHAVPELGAAISRVLSDQDMRSRAAEVAHEIAQLPDGRGVVDEICRLTDMGPVAGGP